MAGSAMAVGSTNLLKSLTLRAPNAGLDTGLPLSLRDLPSVSKGGCFYWDGRRLSKAHGTRLVRRRAPFLSAARERGEVDIVEVKKLADGSQLFTFGRSPEGPFSAWPRASSYTKRSVEPQHPSEGTQLFTFGSGKDGSSEPPSTATSAQPRSRGSSFTKRPVTPKRPPRTEAPGSKSLEENPPEPSQAGRPPSSFVRRSPIPHSSTRTPASETPVAVSPTVTAAHGAKSAPSASAPLTGVRERTEAPVPTQDRLRPKSQFVRRSPVVGGRDPRAAVPSSDEMSSSNNEQNALGRPESSFSKRSPVLGKAARKPEAVTETVEPAGSGRLPSSFRKASPVAGRPAREVPGITVSESEKESAGEDGPARAQRGPSSFKRVPLVAGRPVRKVPDSAVSLKGTPTEDGAPRPQRPTSSFKKVSQVAGRPERKVPESALSEKETAEKEGAGRPERAGTTFKKASPITAKGRGDREPGPRGVQDLTGIVTNGVAKAAGAVEKTVEKLMDKAITTGGGAADSEEKGGPASGETDLNSMKLPELRQLAKERKIKGIWTMKKAELIEALEVSFSENV